MLVRYVFFAIFVVTLFADCTRLFGVEPDTQRGWTLLTGAAMHLVSL
jgi:hypothetical protein